MHDHAELSHEFLLNTPGNSTSFLIEPWSGIFTCSSYPRKFHGHYFDFGCGPMEKWNVYRKHRFIVK